MAKKQFEVSAKIKIGYEIIFTILALATVTITLLDILEKLNLEKNIILSFLDNAITYIFIIDYFLRFFFSQNKKSFFKKNIPDLIAIIPFNSLFKALRIVKLFKVLKLVKLSKLTKLFRLFGLLARLHKKLKIVLNSHGLIYSIWFAAIVILLGAIGIYFAEKGQTVNTFQDSIWWAFVTATTVGYGDISPATQLGRFIAAILMLTGIGTIGLLTSSISAYFIQQNNLPPSLDSDICFNQKIIEETTNMSKEEVLEILNYIKFVKSKRN